MTKVAFVFPGQGSQFVGMGADICGAFAAARSVFVRAGEVLSMDMEDLCFNGPADALNLTVNTQLAVLVAEVAAYEALREKTSFYPHFLAGHSLGEYAAIYAAGALELSELLSIVQVRARCHQDAVPAGEGAMAAVMGLDAAAIRSVCEEFSIGMEEVAEVANLNGPNQTVISGHARTLVRVLDRLTAIGAKKCVRLPISVPCHSRLMTEAALVFRRSLETISFRPFRVPVLPNYDPRCFHSPETAAELLWRQMIAPVRWQETVERLAEMGVEMIVEIGPRKVLTSLIKGINRHMRILFAGDVASVEETAAVLNNLT